MNKLFFSGLLLITIIACNKVSGTPAEGKADEFELNANGEAASASTTTKLSAKDLAPYFDRKKSGDEDIIQPKAVAADGNGVYCYFMQKGEKAKGLRLHIQYWGKNYPEADLYRFDIDGKTTEYIANRDKQASANTRIVQNIILYWYDNSINKADQEFLEGLTKASKAQLSLIDRATNEVVSTITLTDKDKQSIQHTLDYYFALDGAKIPKKGMVNIRG